MPSFYLEQTVLNNIHLHFSRKGHLTHWVLGAILLMSTFLGQLYFQFYEYKEQHQHQIQNELSLRLHEEFFEVKETLKALVSVYTHTESLDSQIEFTSLTQGYLKTTPGLKQIGFAPYLNRSNLGQFILGMREQGYESYRVYNCDAEGSQPSVDQNQLLPVQFVSPFTPKATTALGKNLFSLYDFNQIKSTSGQDIVASNLIIEKNAPLLLLFAPIIFQQHQNEQHQLEGVFFSVLNLDEWIATGMAKSLTSLPDSIAILSSARAPYDIQLLNTPLPIFEFSTRLTLDAEHLKNSPYQIVFNSSWGIHQAHWVPVFLSLLLVLFVYVFILYLLQTIRHYTETLRINEQRFYQYFKNSHEAIIVTDPDGTIIYWNPMAEEIFGYHYKETLNKPVTSVLLNGQYRTTKFEDYLSYPTENHFETSFVTKSLNTIKCQMLVTEFQYRHKSEYALFIEDITQQKHDEAEIKHLAFYDTLTGLENRTFFTNTVTRFIETNPYTPGAVFFIDLDGFKKINDSLGHEFGDELLKIVARRLKHAIRASELSQHLCRFGGDEFLLMLTHINQDAAYGMAQRILERLKRPVKVFNEELHISASIGIAFYPEHGKDLSTLLRHADTAMYKAKANGKNTFAIYDNQLESNLAERLTIERNLNRALKLSQFELHYQPQIDTQSETVKAVEALIRWIHPDLGFISPEKFISIAETSGQILDIGDWVLTAAINQLKAWDGTEFEHLHIAINVSSQQLEKTNFIDRVHALMDEAELPFERLEIELTERSIMSSAQDNIELFHRIRDKGFKISVDDFGTGYSSLSYLKRFPLNILKVDKSFVDGLPQDEEDISISSAIINLAHSLNMQVIAEGVETKEQLTFLKEQGCNMVQGYYYSKPLPIHELEAWIKDYETKLSNPPLT